MRYINHLIFSIKHKLKMVGIFIIVFIIMFLIPLIKQLRIRHASNKTLYNNSYLFNDFVLNDFFASEKYSVKNLSDKSDSLHYDFQVTQISTSINFLIKTIFVNGDARKNMIKWCSDEQFSGYYNTNQTPLFILIGVGRDAYLPDELYLIPFKTIPSNIINVSLINQYRVMRHHDVDFSEH